MMTYEEISDLLQFNQEHENIIFMPNEIFTDLKQINNSSGQLAFTYSYYYLINWLYRYTKYGNCKQQIDQKLIKQILSHSPNYREANHIIKKHGFLDKLGYTETTNDIPLYWSLNSNESYSPYDILDKNELKFYTLSDFNKDETGVINFPSNYKIKRPVKAFTRYIHDEEWEEEYTNGYIDGTYYNIGNTHMISFNIFMFCMSKKKIGCTGFYLYSYLKSKNQIYKNGYDISFENLSLETGLPNTTLERYIDILKSYRMIDFIHNQDYFVVGLKQEERKANTYITNEYDLFTDQPVKYERMKIMKRAEYFKKLKEEYEQNNSKVDISTDHLPY